MRREFLWNEVKPRRDKCLLKGIEENVKYAPSNFSFENILNVRGKLLDFKHYKQATCFLNIIMFDSVLS